MLAFPINSIDGNDMDDLDQMGVSIQLE